MTSSSEPTVRLALPEDGDAVCALARAFHTEDGHPVAAGGLAALTAMLPADSPHGRVLVLDAGGALCGYGALCFGYTVEYEGRDAFIDDLYVVPPMRGRGLGRRLFAAVEQEARASGCNALHLEVMPGNPVDRWYHTLGYADRRSKLLTKRM